MTLNAVRAAIRDVPDFPKPGIVFKDITPILQQPALFRQALDWFTDRLRADPPDLIAGIESRGFIFGAAVADRLGVGFVPVRKKGKLPAETVEATYDLEYGTATIEMHRDAVPVGSRVVLLDDLLATGGTAAAAASLVEALGGRVVEIDFLVELAFLNGRDKLKAYPVFAPVVF